VNCIRQSNPSHRQVDGISRRLIFALAIPLLLVACSANGDFGRLKPELVNDDIHSWVARDAAREVGAPISKYPLTDEERLLRDLAYPLIEPPYDRHRWYAIVNEYGLSHAMSVMAQGHGWDFFEWPAYELPDYGKKLLTEPYRSATARYAHLNTDIRNDVARVPDFFATARRVFDLDDKRLQSQAYVTALSPAERKNAAARVAENRLVVGWVERGLVHRVEGYCWALQRLVIATPAPMAVEAERSLTLLNTRIAENWLSVGRNIPPPGPGCGEAVAAALPTGLPVAPIVSK
jgi:hypothetical protein